MAKRKYQEVGGIKFTVTHGGELLESAKVGIRLWTPSVTSTWADWHSEYTENGLGFQGRCGPSAEAALSELLSNSEKDFAAMKERAIQQLIKIQKAYDKLPGNKKGS